MPASISSFLLRIVNSSAPSSDPDDVVHANVCNVCALFGFGITVFYFCLYLAMDAALFAPILRGNALLIPLWWTPILINRLGYYQTAKIVFFAITIIELVFDTWVLGNEAGTHLFLLALPSLALLMYRPGEIRYTVGIALVCGVTFGITHKLTNQSILPPYPEAYRMLFFVFSVSGMLGLQFLALFIFSRRLGDINENLQVALDYMPGAIMAGNEQGEVIFVNERTNQLFKLPEGHVKAGDSLFWALDEMIKAGADHTDMGEQFTTEQVYGMFESRDTVPLTMKHRDGRYLEAVMAPSPSGGSVAVATDISERRELIDELKQQRSISDAAMQNMGEGILMVGSDGKVAAYNRRVAEYFGFSEAEAATTIGQDFEELLRYAYVEKLEMPQEYEASIKRLREGGAFSYDDALPDGSIIETRHNPMPDGGFVRVYLDVTEMRHNEESLREARQAAEDSAQAKSEFLANMSHEIRTPMNAVLGLTHLALKTQLDPRQRDYLQKVHGSATALLTIINDILDVSKIEAGKLDMEAIDFSLDEMLANVATLIGDKAREKGLEFLFSVPRDLRGQLVGDPLRLSQVLINLASNAVKFTDAGEVVISVKLLDESDHDVQLQFSVRDTGIGLKPEQIDNLFQSFSQADTSTTRKYGGTGLGLSICKSLVQMMHGQIWVKSDYGEGSTFNFTARFPRSETGAEPAELRLAEELRGKRVLVVDDNTSARYIFEEMLASFSLDVRAVDSGAAAIEEISGAESAFDLVIMDWQMPGMDGFRAIEEIRALDLPANPRFIMATAFGREEMFNKAEAAQLDGVILKPVNPSTMFDAIMNAFGLESVLGQRRMAGDDYDMSTLRPVQGARILLAEDNEINQQVARELLEGAGFRVDIANNGVEAVDMANSGDYELVLMDVQMPEMDGNEAARTIRGNSDLDAMPILAMTSGVMDDERQRSLEAGMVDHVAKPIEIRQLFDAVLRWIPHGDRELPATYTASSPGSADLHFPERLEGIDIGLGLSRTGHNRRLYLDLLVSLRDSKAEVVDEIRAALQAGDSAQAADVAHNLAGVAGNLGAAALSAAAKDLEHGLNQDGLAVPPVLIESVQGQLDVVMAALAGISDGYAPAPRNGAIDWSSLQERLRQLRKMVENYEPTANGLLDELTAELADEAMAESCKALVQALAAFDFEAALEPLDALESEVERHMEKDA